MRVNVSFVNPKLKGILCYIGIDSSKEIELFFFIAIEFKKKTTFTSTVTAIDGKDILSASSIYDSHLQ